MRRSYACGGNRTYHLGDIEVIETDLCGSTDDNGPFDLAAVTAAAAAAAAAAGTAGVRIVRCSGWLTEQVVFRW